MTLWSTSDFLKTVYLPGINNELTSAYGTAYGQAQSSAETVSIEGKNPVMKLRVGDSLGQGTIAENGDYPTAGDPDYDEATVELAHIAHTINWSSEEMAFLDSSSAAAAAVIEEKMTAAKNAMQLDIVRQFWSDGSGVLANVASSSGSTITLDATTTSQIDRDRYLWIDDQARARYDVVNGTTGADQVTGFTVTNVAESTNILTCSATMTSATSAGVVVRAGDWESGGAFRSLEFDGIQAMVDDDNTYLNINRSTAGKGYWKSTVLANSGTLRALSETLVWSLLNKMARRADSGTQPGADGSAGHRAYANFGVWTAYHNLMAPGLRYSLNEKPDIGWNKPIDLLGIPFYRDLRCPNNNIFVLHMPSIMMLRPRHNGFDNLLKFKEYGGSVFFQGNAASGAGHSAQVFSYLEGFLGMATKRPRNHGRLDDVTGVSESYL